MKYNFVQFLTPQFTFAAGLGTSCAIMGLRPYDPNEILSQFQVMAAGLPLATGPVLIPFLEEKLKSRFNIPVCLNEDVLNVSTFTFMAGGMMGVLGKACSQIFVP